MGGRELDWLEKFLQHVSGLKSVPLTNFREASQLTGNLCVLLSIAGTVCGKAGFYGEETLNGIICSVSIRNPSEGLKNKDIASRDLFHRFTPQWSQLRLDNDHGDSRTSGMDFLRVLAKFPSQQRIPSRVYLATLNRMGFSSSAIQKFVQMAETYCLIEPEADTDDRDGGLWMQSFVQSHILSEDRRPPERGFIAALKDAFQKEAHKSLPSVRKYASLTLRSIGLRDVDSIVPSGRHEVIVQDGSMSHELSSTLDTLRRDLQNVENASEAEKTFSEALRSCPPKYLKVSVLRRPKRLVEVNTVWADDTQDISDHRTSSAYAEA